MLGPSAGVRPPPSPGRLNRPAWLPGQHKWGAPGRLWSGQKTIPCTPRNSALLAARDRRKCFQTCTKRGLHRTANVLGRQTPEPWTFSSPSFRGLNGVPLRMKRWSFPACEAQARRTAGARGLPRSPVSLWLFKSLRHHRTAIASDVYA